MLNHLVSIFIPVRNGEKYIRHCLNSVLRQTYQPIEIVVFDNNSDDNTVNIVEKEYPAVTPHTNNFGVGVKIHKNDRNLFVGPAFNEAFRRGLCRGEFILLLCVDVILDENFILEAVKTMQNDSSIGVLQAKTLKFDFLGEKIEKTNIIDTTGFEIFKSRRAINRGHGDKDRGQYNNDGEVFSYEGAAGFFRKQALEEAMIKKEKPTPALPYQGGSEIFDENFEWMVDDLDLGWRLRLFKWKNYYNHKMVCYHDRKTTKRLSGNRLDFIRQRKEIPAIKRKLDYRNMHLTLIKNDFCLLFLKDFWYIFWREIQLFFYILFFERSTIPAFFEIFGLSPEILKKRKEIMTKKKVDAKKIEKWFKRGFK